MIDARSGRRLAFAAALSGVAHAAIVVLGRLDLPQSPEDPLPLAARIVSAPAATGAPPPAPQPVRVKHAARARMPSVPIPFIPAPSAIGPLEEAETADATEVAGTEPATLEEPAAAPAAAEPVIIATAPPSTYVPEPPAVRNLPRKGRITYSLVYGRDKFPVGRTVQTWQMDQGSYRLASRSETTGIVDLVRSQQRTYSSQGALTREGLRPMTFVMSRNRGRGLEATRAEFDWSNATVTLGNPPGQRHESLSPRSQDLLSFMYQLSLAPPRPGRLRQAVTNGSGMETYDLEVRAEETIDTPLGALRALPIKQVPKAGDEAIELWLATEYHYLPVRLRFFNREGEPQGEQIVTEIRLSDE